MDKVNSDLKDRKVKSSSSSKGKAMDDIARYNKERWEDLAAHNVPFSRPMLDLTEESARAYVDSRGVLGDLSDRDVLCLAGAGGQQSAAFALLGAGPTLQPASVGAEDLAALGTGIVFSQLSVEQGSQVARLARLLPDGSLQILSEGFHGARDPDVSFDGKRILFLEKTYGDVYEVEVDTIFFLSDGRPSHGHYTDPQDILRAVQEANALRRIVIHTIGIGEYQRGFMQALADQNGGVFVDLGK